MPEDFLAITENFGVKPYQHSHSETKTNPKRVILLCDYNNELATEYLHAFLKNNIKIDAIVAIGDEYSKNRAKILRQRTGGLYKQKWFQDLLSGENIPVYITNDYNKKYTFDLLSSLEPDIILLAGTVIIRQPLWSIPKLGILNCHSAIVQCLRGCSCLEWSILKDIPIGVTCHTLGKIVDNGPILSQAILEINEEDSYESIRTKSLYLWGLLMLESYYKIISADFDVHNLKVPKKGTWHSPMQDPDLLEQVENKILEKKYQPQFTRDLSLIKKIKIDLPFHEYDQES